MEDGQGELAWVTGTACMRMVLTRFGIEQPR